MALGETALKLETWILYHLSRSITWSVNLESMKCGQITTFNVILYVVLSVYHLLVKI